MTNDLPAVGHAALDGLHAHDRSGCGAGHEECVDIVIAVLAGLRAAGYAVVLGRDRLTAELETVRPQPRSAGANAAASMRVDEPLSDQEWALLLQLIVRHTADHRFQQWDTFSLPLPKTINRLYVHWGMQSPEGHQYEHLYPLVDPTTGRRANSPEQS